jgi:hypothetical protein
MVNQVPRYEDVLGKWGYSCTISLTSALDGGELLASLPCRFTPRERATIIHWTGGSVGPSIVLDAVMKRRNSQPLPGVESYNPYRPARSQSLYRLSYHDILCY